MSAEAAAHEAVTKRYSRLNINRLGLWLFIASESFLFLAFLSARFLLLGTFRPEELNQTLGLVVTSILLLSSLTAYRAESSIAHGDQSGFLNHTLATIVLGLVFLVGLGVEWVEGFGHYPPSDQYGTLYFSITALHGLHVLSGIVLLALAYLNGSRWGRYSVDDYWGVEATVKYWHFVDVAWVFIYPILYLIG